MSVLFVSLLSTWSAGAAGSLNLAWDPSPATGLSGYIVRYATTSGQYTMSTNVGNTTTATIGGLQDGLTYYLVVTAVSTSGMESDPSNEVGYTMATSGINDAPTLGSIADRTVPEDAGTQTVTISGISTGDSNELQTLTVTATSSNPSLIPNPTVNYSSPNISGTLTFRAAANASGTAIISVTVNDGQLLNNLVARTFTVTVTPVNDAPTVSSIPDQSIARDTSSAAIGFTIGDIETAAGSLTLAAASSNPTLVPTTGIVFGGSGANRTVTINPAGGQTGSATITVTVSDGSAVASDVFVVTVNAPGVGPKSFTNQTSITIADVGAGAPYPSPIAVSGLAGTVSQVTLTLRNISHSYPDDIDVLLVGPAGQKVMVLSDVGGGNPISGVTATLSDAAASLMSDEGLLVSGTYRPTDAAPGEVRDVFPAPAPAGPYSASLTSFNGQSPNGTWSLYVNDDGAGDQGLVGGGWTLTITTTATADALPTISDIAAQATPANTPTAPIPFTVNDAETPAGNLVVTGSSSNPTLVPNAGIVFGGSGSSRTVTLTPAIGQSGTANITVTVADAAGGSASDTFTLTVTAPNPPTIVLTSPASGAGFTAPATIGLAASVNANGNTISKVQFYGGSTLLGEASSAPYSFSWSGVSAGNYSVIARLVYGAGSTVDSPAVNVAVADLPAPWLTADIGSVGIAGSASGAGGVYTVSGAGNLSGTADNYRFVYQTLSGDGEIKMRLDSVANTGTSGRAGVMIRESLTGGSRYAFMGISPDGTLRWQRRSSTSGSTSSTTSIVGALPNVWVRLVRTGTTVYGYRSADGVIWTKVSSRSITMATTIYIGMAVASGSSATLNTSAFSNATVVP